MTELCSIRREWKNFRNTFVEGSAGAVTQGVVFFYPIFEKQFSK